MKRGRRAKSASLRRAQGNPGRRPLPVAAAPPQNPELPPVGADSISQFQPPSELTDRAAIRLWQRTAPKLAGINFIKSTDVDAFARYCKMLSLWYGIAAKVEPKSIVVRTFSEDVEMDRLGKHFQAMLLLDKRLEALEDRFGLNPAARLELLRG